MQVFLRELKNLKGHGLSNLSIALKTTFDLLNMYRLQSGIDNYGMVCMKTCFSVKCIKSFIQRFIFTHLYMLLFCLSVCLSVCLSIRCTKWQIILPLTDPCIIWFSFMVHMCKMIIFPGVFLFFHNFDFLGGYRGKRAKMAQNDKNLSVLLHISEIIHHIILIHSKHMLNDNITSFLGGERVKNDPKLPISVSCSISQELWIISRFLVHRCKVMISPGVFLYFFKKCNINIKILTFFIDPLQ